MLKFVAGAVVIAASVAACSGTDMQPPTGCETMAFPGVLVAVPGIDLQVRDTYGQGEAIGTTATVTRAGSEPMQVNIADTLHIYSAYDVTGDFSVQLSRPYYQSVTIAKVTVTPDGCLVNTTAVPVTMQLVSGAPPLRAVAVAGATYLGEARAQAHLVAQFDADPNVSRAVTWQVNDTTLVTIDGSGTLTAKCPNPGGTAWATATSVVNPSVSGRSPSMSVAPFTTCP